VREVQRTGPVTADECAGPRRLDGADTPHLSRGSHRADGADTPHLAGRLTGKRPCVPVPVAFMGVALAFLVMVLPGCVLLAGKSTPAPPPPPPKPAPAPKMVIERTDAFAAFDRIRNDLLSAAPHLGSVNGAFALGIDVSGSAHASGVLEDTIKVLTDMCGFFFSPGDRIVVIPWDSRIRENSVSTFDYNEPDEARENLTHALEALEGLVDPESRGSNVLDARGYCMERALKLWKDSGGKLCPVVLIFSDTYTPDMTFGKQKYTRERLAALRKDFAGEDGEFAAGKYGTREGRQIILHRIIGPDADYARAEGVDRKRAEAQVKVTAPTATYTPPPPPPDYSGWRIVFMIVAILSLVALIGLPMAWRHRLLLGDTRETMRAFGGRIVVQSGRGISPRGVVFLPVPGLDDRPLVAFEGKGPQILVTARRGVRLNDGRTELTVPLGKPVTLRIAIDGVPGEQSLDVHAADFFSTNTGPIIGMITALIVLIGCIVG